MSDITSTQPGKGLAIAAMVCGIIAICIPFLGLVLGLIALILAIVCLAKKRPGQGMAIAGLVTGIISLVVSVIITIFTVAIIGAVANYCSENSEICEQYTQSSSDCDLHFGADGDFSMICSNTSNDPNAITDVTDTDTIVEY